MSDFKPGDLVCLSLDGWGHGLAVGYAYTFGKVISYERGVLTVHREGMTRPQAYAPKFWEKVTQEDIDHLREEEARFGSDYHPTYHEDLHFSPTEDYLIWQLNDNACKSKARHADSVPKPADGVDAECAEERDKDAR